jgi:cobalt-zinc-cadmium efflux system membrane fusion protein
MKKFWRPVAFLVAALALAAAGWLPAAWPADEHGHDHAGHAQHAAHAAHPPVTENHDDPEHGEHDEHGHLDEHADEARLSAEAIRQYGIVVEPVRKRALNESLTAPARVAFNAEAMAHVGAPVEGRVTEIPARLGDRVERGDVLLVIDSPLLGEAQSDFLQALTGVEVARAALDVAETTYERSRALLEGKGLSLGEFQRREGDYRIAGGNLLAAKASALAAENRLHLYAMTQDQVESLKRSGEIDARYRVRASISGTVVEREATLGEVVGPDREALMVLADLSTYWVLADVPEARIAKVAIDSPARVTIAALGRETFPGRVAYVAPQLNAATRTAQVRIEIAGPEARLQAGMFGQAELSAAGDDALATATALAVPDAAVQTVEGGPAVFVPVPGEPGAFAKRAVAVGPRIGGWIPVFSGLTEGEPIVTRGSFILKAELGKAGAEHVH